MKNKQKNYSSDTYIERKVKEAPKMVLETKWKATWTDVSIKNVERGKEVRREEAKVKAKSRGRGGGLLATPLHDYIDGARLSK
jgi:hypothetical protein